MLLRIVVALGEFQNRKNPGLGAPSTRDWRARGEPRPGLPMHGVDLLAPGLAEAEPGMTAKAAIEGLARGLARDVGEDDIRVDCIVPGAVRTPRQELLWHTPDEEVEILAGPCLRERVEVQDVAAPAPALLLASANAARCTGRAFSSTPAGTQHAHGSASSFVAGGSAAGEGAMSNAASESVHFVDIRGCQVHRCAPDGWRRQSR